MAHTVTTECDGYAVDGSLQSAGASGMGLHVLFFVFVFLFQSLCVQYGTLPFVAEVGKGKSECRYF